MERSDKISNTKASVVSNTKSGYDEIVPIQESEHVSLDFGEPQGGQRAPSHIGHINDEHALGEVGFSMSRSRVQVDLLNKKSSRYLRGVKKEVFNEDFEELRMITHEDRNEDFEDEDEVMMDSNPIVETEQSEFRKLPQLDSFDSDFD